MSKNIKKKPLPKPPSEQDILFEQLFGYGTEEPPNQPQVYRVRLACEVNTPYLRARSFTKKEHHWSSPDRPVTGIFADRRFCLLDTHGLNESHTALTHRIAVWKSLRDNSVNVIVHNAHCMIEQVVVHYVEMLPSKWFSGWACPWREYNALRMFIRSLPEYQRCP